MEKKLDAERERRGREEEEERERDRTAHEEGGFWRLLTALARSLCFKKKKKKKRKSSIDFLSFRAFLWSFRERRTRAHAHAHTHTHARRRKKKKERENPFFFTALHFYFNNNNNNNNNARLLKKGSAFFSTSESVLFARAPRSGEKKRTRRERETFSFFVLRNCVCVSLSLSSLRRVAAIFKFLKNAFRARRDRRSILKTQKPFSPIGLSSRIHEKNRRSRARTGGGVRVRFGRV